MGEPNAWVDATVAGFRAMSESDSATSAKHWLAARDALLQTDPDDPRLAAAQTNAGAALALLGRRREADAALADAEARWMRLLSFIATAEVPVSGRSSSFHFTLASQNLGAFRDAQRRRFARLCDAGLVITRFNRLLASAELSPSDALIPGLASQLGELLGAHSPEVRLLRTEPIGQDSTAPLYADKITAFETLRALTSAPGDDWRRLEIAVALTAMLPPGFPLESWDEPQRRSPPVKSPSHP